MEVAWYPVNREMKKWGLQFGKKKTVASVFIASYAGLFSGARISSLPTNAVCGEGRNTLVPLKTRAWEASVCTAH